MVVYYMYMNVCEPIWKTTLSKWLIKVDIEIEHL